MWKPFKYNMRLVTFLLLIQMGYIIAKAIENPRSCNDSPENDPRLKRSDEKGIHFDSEETTHTAGEDLEDDATRKTFSKSNNESDIDHDITDNDNENSNEFALDSNSLPQEIPLVNNFTKFPAHVEKSDIVTDTLTTTKDSPLQEPVYYKAIDPKYLIISGLSLPKTAKNITNVSTPQGPVNIDLKETKTTPLDYSNQTMNVSNRDEANDTVRKEVVIDNTETNVSNIRELREHLLDHLLDYFINIIKEENYIRNDTRKKNGKDRMKVEEKLRNYYDPHHLDMFFDDDDNYYDNNLGPSDDRRSNNSEEDLLDIVQQDKEVNEENLTNIYPLTLADEADKNTAEAHTFPEGLQKEALNLEQNLNISSPDGKSFNVSSSEPSPVTSNYVNLIEKGNYLSNVLLNTTEKPGDTFDTNANIITTTEISISSEALNDKAAEVDTGVLNDSEEAITDRIEYIYDNDALTVDDYTSYDDYIDSDEFEVVKNVRENDRNPIVISTENGRRKNGLEKEKYSANDTLNESYNNKNYSQIRNNVTTSKDIASERKDTPTNVLAIQDLPNKNINDNSPRTDDNLADNKNKNSTKNSKRGTKRKLRCNKKCGNLVNKNNKSINKKPNKQTNHCRKSIIVNLNINLI